MTTADPAALGERMLIAAPWLATPLLGNPLWRYACVLATLLAFALLHRLLTRVVLRGLRRFTARTRATFDEPLVAAIEPPLACFVVVFGGFVATRWLLLDPSAAAVLLKLLRIAAILCGGWAVGRCAGEVVRLLLRLARRTHAEFDDRFVPLVERVARIVVAVLAVILVIHELEFDVSGIITGLGVGGLAFALAAKDTLANWFGALMIFTDRPFAVGDWIKTPALEGTVEDIGLRSTRIRSFAMTVISIPNSILANEAVENFSRMPVRRVAFDLRVTYTTSPAALREVVARIEQLLRGHEGVDQKFWMVKFTDLAESSLTIMIYYFTRTTDWAAHLQVRGDISLAILDVLAELGVEIALPARTVHLREEDTPRRS